MSRTDYRKYLKSAAPSLAKVLGATILLFSLAWPYYINSRLEPLRAMNVAGNELVAIMNDGIAAARSPQTEHEKAVFERLEESISDFEVSLIENRSTIRKVEGLLRRDVFWISLFGGALALIGTVWEIHRKTVKEIKEDN